MRLVRLGLPLGFLVGLLGLSQELLPSSRADEPIKISETQLTFLVQQVKAQGTVIALTDEVLTIVTAAHFLTPADEGKTVVANPGSDRQIEGRVLAVVTNPLFPLHRTGKTQNPRAEDSVGVDTEVVRLKFDLKEGETRRVLGAIRCAEVAPRPFPGSRDQIVRVHIVDQRGEEHIVRAGNHLNPKCLAWGRGGFEPKPGDSGAGVFVLRKTATGGLIPTLIATVSQSDSRGGIASLVHSDAPWFARAIAP